MVIENAHAGIAAGRSAGMTVIGIATTFPRTELDCELCVDDLRAVTVSDGAIEGPGRSPSCAVWPPAGHLQVTAQGVGTWTQVSAPSSFISSTTRRW